MTTETKKEGEFDPGCVVDIFDKIYAHNFALRALSELLGKADLDAFAESSYGEGHKEEASNLRWGISQLIDLCLDHQESILSGYCDQYHQSDICVLERAESCINLVKQGAFSTREAATSALQEKVLKLDFVIDRGGQLKDRAVALKEFCLLLKAQLNGQKVSVCDQPANPQNKATVHHDDPIIKEIVQGLGELDEEGKRNMLRFAIKVKNRSRVKQLAPARS